MTTGEDVDGVEGLEESDGVPAHRERARSRRMVRVVAGAIAALILLALATDRPRFITEREQVVVEPCGDDGTTSSVGGRSSQGPKPYWRAPSARWIKMDVRDDAYVVRVWSPLRWGSHALLDGSGALHDVSWDDEDNCTPYYQMAP